MSELKPCPFCGDFLLVTKAGMAVHDHQNISRCFLATLGIPVDSELMTTAWNTRPPVTAQEAAKVLLDAYDSTDNECHGTRTRMTASWAIHNARGPESYDPFHTGLRALAEKDTGE